MNNFDIAKQQALEIGAKAGELALDAAQSLHTKATRLALAITVNVSISTDIIHFYYVIRQAGEWQCDVLGCIQVPALRCRGISSSLARGLQI